MKKVFTKILATMMLLSVATLTMSSACSRDDDDDTPNNSSNSYASLILGRWELIEVITTYSDGYVERVTDNIGDVSEFKSDGTMVVDDVIGCPYSISGEQLTLTALGLIAHWKIIELNSTSLVIESYEPDYTTIKKFRRL